MNSRTQQIEWRRSQVLELSSKGHSQSDIAKIMQVDKSIISRDISFIRECSRLNIKKYLEERLPEEYEKCLVGLTAILKEAWITSQQSSDWREKIQALSLAKDCYSMKLELLTNAAVIDDVIKFITSNLKVNDKITDSEKAKSKSANYLEHTEYDIQGSAQNNSTTKSTYNHIF